MRLQFSPTDGDEALVFGLEQAGLLGDLATLQGRLDSLLGEGDDTIFSDFLAVGFDGVLAAFWLQSGIILRVVSLILGCLVQGSSQRVDGLGKNLLLPKNAQAN